MEPFGDYIKQAAIDYLKNVFYLCDNNMSDAAKIAGKNRTDMYKLINRYRLDRAKPSGPLGTPIEETFMRSIQRSAVEYLNAVLRATRNNVSEAARIAGKNRTDMYKLLHRYGVMVRRPQGNDHWRSLADR